MSDAEYRLQARGEQSAWRAILRLTLGELRCTNMILETDDPYERIARLEHLHAETIAALRAACEEFGDNEWEDDLHPADIIEKHLMRDVREMILNLRSRGDAGELHD